MLPGSLSEYQAFPKTGSILKVLCFLSDSADKETYVHVISFHAVQVFNPEVLWNIFQSNTKHGQDIHFLCSQASINYC